MTVGDVLGDTVRTMGAQAVPLLGVSLLLQLPANALYYWTVYHYGARIVRRAGAHPTDYFRPQVMGAYAVLWMASAIATAAVSYGVFQVARGGEFRIGQAITAALGRWRNLMFTSVATGVLVAFGAVLCIVPGLVLGTMLAVAMPVCAIEGGGVDAAMRRSRALTKGSRMAVAFTYGVVTCLVFGVAWSVSWILKGHPAQVDVVMTLSSTCTSLVSSTLVAVLYWHLRAHKEGIDAEQTAALFE
jgi:hypothetical protein